MIGPYPERKVDEPQNALTRAEQRAPTLGRTHAATDRTLMTRAEIAEWARAENARRTREESDEPEGVVLLEAERFSDEYAGPDAEIEGGRGPHSSIIADLLAGACAGWKQRPNAAEFHAAMRAAAPDARQRAITGVLIKEGTVDQVLLAHLQGAFTWRQLVRRMHERAVCDPALARYVNRWADKERT